MANESNCAFCGCPTAAHRIRTQTIDAGSNGYLEVYCFGRCNENGNEPEPCYEDHDTDGAGEETLYLLLHRGH